MLRLNLFFGVLAVTMVALAGNAPAAVTCTYDSCVAACQKLGGGGKQGGCSTWCDRTIRERQQSGVCKKQ